MMGGEGSRNDMTATNQIALRRADAMRNRERILDAAERILERSPSATLTDIAAAAGVARSTLHRRFPNRDALLAALQTRPQETSLETPDGSLPAGRLGEGTTGQP
jgi:AcrR family transcriptional regulator